MTTVPAPIHQNVVILDYGSQFTQLITRRVRELGIYSVILSGDSSWDSVWAYQPRAVILSGGPNSVYDDGAPALPRGLLAGAKQAGIPILGICYGMQLLVHELGGKVAASQTREYGRMPVRVVEKNLWLLGGVRPGQSSQVWMSHGDAIARLPEGFTLLAESEQGVPAAIENATDKLYALQFHPEVVHTEGGMETLKGFLLKIAGIRPDWTLQSIIDEQIEKIQKKVGPTEHAICALSGGVDSAVAAVLVHRALGDRLHCVFVDHGLLRHRESERVMTTFREKLHLPVTRVDASERFLTRLAGVSDPEQKRKIIGAQFIEVFDEFAHAQEKKLGHVPRFLVQGTLYPDVIESSAAGGKKAQGFSVTIKSHHNVGGLPEGMRMQLIEPLRDLFKDEVRKLGLELGVPQEFLARHPFPGPGLAVRILGDITQERIALLQKVDEIFIEAIREAGLYDQIWQAFAVFLPIKSVGVQGDGRTHDHVVALRAVTSQDGMTADWVPFDLKFLAEVSNRICNRVRGVNRVVYDISSKPPATIEWE